MNQNLIQYEKANEYYKKILEIFDFDPQKDRQARDILAEYQKNHNFRQVADQLEQRVRSRSIFFFFGAGPNLREELNFLKKEIHAKREMFFLTAADGAALALKEKHLIPDLIVTDLDGLGIGDVEFFLNEGANIAIHGHGDNINLLREFRPIIEKYPNIICTTQVTAAEPVINPGGFTDGDRGIFLMHHLVTPALRFILIGYSFGDTIGPFSKPHLTAATPMTPVKTLKMKFARELLDHIADDLGRKLIFFGHDGE